MKRRSFLKKAVSGATALSSTSLMAFGFDSFDYLQSEKQGSLKISLAQWSLHRQIEQKLTDPKDFASVAMNTYGINAIEYVNQFYSKSVNDEKFWLGMKERANDVGVTSLLIMVDEEGDFGLANTMERKKSVENHYKWVNAAKILGCHSIRVNAFGDGNKEVFRNAMVDSMGQLSEYGAKENINIIIENHGLYSSNAKLITDIVKQVDKPNFGTFPDFGNWCQSAKWGSTKIKCENVYNIYQGVSEFLPYAKAVSAKSYDFDEKGEHAKIDYYKMLKIVKDFGYKGHIGIEYEGDSHSEHEGIIATKKLMEKAWASLQ